MHNRYEKCFSALKQKKQGAFVAFVMLGDPDLPTSYKIIQTLIENGADALELGIPFSDPIADGAVIQASAIRALKNNIKVNDCFQLLKKLRQQYPQIPVGLLLYSNLVIAKGIENFYQSANESGVDSILIADVPILEAQPFIAAAKKNQIAPIFIATPNASEETLKKIAEHSKGYTYLLSRAGVTGTEVKAEMPLKNIISTLKQYQAPPTLLGFGISSATQVAQAIKNDADGVISGSAVVKIVQQYLDQPEVMYGQLAKFIHTMKQATQ